MQEEDEATFIHPKALVESEQVGAGSRVWAFAHVCAGAIVGRGCSIGDHAYIESGVRVGDGVTIKNNVSVWEGVHVADNVFLGPGAMFTNDLHPRSDQDFELTETHIEEGATVGANATIVCGVTLGRRCFVAAGALVTRDVPPHAFMMGSPARQRGWACHCGLPLRGDDAKLEPCTRCARAYEASDGTLRER
jgi:acetyltransferase-like isoleucine patch superfamily enzyme